MAVSAEMFNLLFAVMIIAFVLSIYNKLNTTVKLLQYYQKTKTPMRWISLQSPVFEDLRFTIWTSLRSFTGDWVCSYSPDIIRTTILPRHTNQVLRQALGTEVFANMQQSEPSVYCSLLKWTAHQCDELESKGYPSSVTSVLKLNLGVAAKFQNSPVRIKIFLGIADKYIENLSAEWEMSRQQKSMSELQQMSMSEPQQRSMSELIICKEAEEMNMCEEKRASLKKSREPDNSLWPCNITDMGTNEHSPSSKFNIYALTPTSYLHSLEVTLNLNEDGKANVLYESKSDASELLVASKNCRTSSSSKSRGKNSCSHSRSIMSIRLEDVEEEEDSEVENICNSCTQPSGMLEDLEIELCLNGTEEVEVKIKWPNMRVFEKCAGSEVFMLLITSTNDSADILCFSPSDDASDPFLQRVKQVKQQEHYIADFTTSMFFKIEDMFGISELNDISDCDTYVRCTACYDDHVSTVFMPCRHACLCVNCLITMMNSSEEVSCPICRCGIEGYARWQTSPKIKLE